MKAVAAIGLDWRMASEGRPCKCEEKYARLGRWPLHRTQTEVCATKPQNGDLVLGEKGVKVGGHVGGIPILRADNLADNFSLAINHVGFRVHG